MTVTIETTVPNTNTLNATIASAAFPVRGPRKIVHCLGLMASAGMITAPAVT